MQNSESQPSFALHWARQLGAQTNSIERLAGGINNRVFRCGEGDNKWIIKGYASLQLGQRDRMKAEVQFLQFANRVAPGFTPDLIHVDTVRRCLVLENIEGKLFTEGVQPNAKAVETATHFIHILNSKPQLAREYIQLDAAEGFLSLHQHLANVQERLQAMSCEHVVNHNKRDAEQLIQHIHANFTEVKNNTERMIREGEVSDEIDLDKRCISPSDFGFHNAINTPTGIRFFDFEFSGWDDPAKLKIDFILQPRIPVLGFGSPLLSAWRPELQRSIKRRCLHLEPILRLKWSCILLTVLNPDRLMQILSITPEKKHNELLQSRLKKAKAYLRIALS